jgi:hypothetical protein
MRRNRLRELLRAGQPSVGTHIHSAWPAVVELAGHSGLFALENLARAVNTFDHMTAMFWFKSEGRGLRDALGGG